MDVIVGGDIGCSSLPPHRADWLMCMNSGIGISQGMSQILKKQLVISTGGEGSFFHAGLTSLQSAVINQLNFLHIVFDNGYVAMTGHQESPTTHKKVNVKNLLNSIGVDQVIFASALNPNEFEQKLEDQLDQKGVRVIWLEGECARRPSIETEIERDVKTYYINPARCGDCNDCYIKLQCPAILKLENEDFQIDDLRCARCGVCREICTHEAIQIRRDHENG